MDIIRNLIKVLLLAGGLFLSYAIINSVIKSVSSQAQVMRDNNANANIVMSSVSREPFGEEVAKVKRGEQIFYNMTIQRQLGSPCFVQTSWRWTLHLPTGNSVMWNSDDGQFYSGDKSENLAQAIKVPNDLIPGHYTLSRLSVFRCGYADEYAKTVRNREIDVE